MENRTVTSEANFQHINFVHLYDYLNDLYSYAKEIQSKESGVQIYRDLYDFLYECGILSYLNTRTGIDVGRYSAEERIQIIINKVKELAECYRSMYSRNFKTYNQWLSERDKSASW